MVLGCVAGSFLGNPSRFLLRVTPPGTACSVLSSIEPAERTQDPVVGGASGTSVLHNVKYGTWTRG